MVQNVVGQVAKDEDFFDRTTYLARLKTEGLRDHLLVLAPRRVGKTSLLYRFATVVEREKGHSAVYVSVQGATDELDFLRKVHDACAAHRSARGVFSRRATGKVGRLLGRVQEVSIAGFGVKLDETEPSRWQERARELMRALEALEGHWFYLVDEVPVFVMRLLREDPTAVRARAFLEWFRSIRQAPLQEELTGHWVLSGSIGLDTIAHRHALSDTINDLRSLHLGAFDDETALAFLSALGEGERVPLSAAVGRRIVERVGWPIPYHLQVLFAELKDRHRESGKAPEETDVDAAFESLLSRHTYFDNWYERLAEELGEQQATRARSVLSASARDPAGASRETLRAVLGGHVADANELERELRFLLDVLTNDGYLRASDDRYVFRSGLLREFWVRRYA